MIHNKTLSCAAFISSLCFIFMFIDGCSNNDDANDKKEDSSVTGDDDDNNDATDDDDDDNSCKTNADCSDGYFCNDDYECEKLVSSRPKSRVWGRMDGVREKVDEGVVQGIAV